MTATISFKRTNGKAIIKGDVILPGSKSISNRALIIKALCRKDFKLSNLSNANDTVVLDNILNHLQTDINVEDAGTVMRFLTAFLSTQKGEWILSGTGRMHERPIGELVNALKELGADIEYLNKDGYPPLKINGTDLESKTIPINANTSSQFVSALLLIAPYIKGGLILELSKEKVSKPYIDMTINLMRHFGVDINVSGNLIQVAEQHYIAKDFFIESDWSAASYFYSIAAFADESAITLHGLLKSSMQGDVVIGQLMSEIGVETQFLDNHKVLLTKSNKPIVANDIDFIDCPDLAQTLAVIYVGLGLGGKFTGLKTLKVKETDRVVALQKEFAKIGISINVLNDEEFSIDDRNNDFSKYDNMLFQTYKDHRMAMAFAPLAVLISNICLDDIGVVKKSFPDYFIALEQLGFKLIMQN